MRKTWVVSKNEFLNQKRSKIFLTLFIVLVFQFVSGIFFILGSGGNFRVRIYERVMSVLSNAFMYSAIISIFCSASMFRDVKSREIDIFYSLNTNSTQYYIGRTLGSFFFYLPTFFIFALLTLIVDIFSFHMAGCIIDFQNLSIPYILYWFVLGFIIMSVIPIAYGVVLPIAFSSYFKKSTVLSASLFLCLLPVFLPQEVIRILRYIYWLYSPYYCSYFFISDSLFTYPKANFTEAVVSILCNIGILLAMFIFGLAKYRHKIADNRFYNQEKHEEKAEVNTCHS
jgi:hypothetical protein